MDVDKFLKEKYGNNNPFITPKGYFDGLEKSIMNRISMQQSNRSKARKLKPLVAWGACIAAVFVGCIVFFDIQNNEIQNIETVSANNHLNVSGEDTVIDEFTDYAMLNNDDIYSYISGE